MSSGNDQPSSSTNPNPSNTTPPRQQGEGSNPSSPQRPRVPIIPPRNPRPIMGIPGVSAFHPFVRPAIQPHQIPPPPPTFPMLPPPPLSYPHTGPSSSFGPGPGSWFGFPGQYGFFAAQPFQVSGFSGSVGGLRIGGGGGGSPSSVRKRVRDGAAMPAPGGGNMPGPQVLDPTECSVCGKKFVSAKALFGHMRTHPGRGWRGAHPPPTFRAEEEFADINMEEAVRAVRAAAAEVAGGVAISGTNHGDGGMGPAEPPPAGEEEHAEGQEEERDQANFKVPDLNNSPPHSE